MSKMEILAQIEEYVGKHKVFVVDSDYSLLRELLSTNSVSLLEAALRIAYECGRKEGIAQYNRAGGTLIDEVNGKIAGIKRLMEVSG